MNDPKQIYKDVDIRGIIGDRPIRYEIINKEWPANDLAYIRLYTEDGRSGWTLAAPGSTVESVTDSVRVEADRLIPKAADCGGGSCGV